MELKVDQKAPDFKLPDENGKLHSLSDYHGKTVVLYFYPKDDTPGCTLQACNFRDDYLKYKAAGAVILGVSPDDERSHEKFKDKFSLPFPLLADADHAVCEKYGVWAEKSMFGNKYFGVVRSTFLIGPDGTIAEVYNKVSVPKHSEKVLKAVEELQAS